MKVAIPNCPVFILGNSVSDIFISIFIESKFVSKKAFVFAVTFWPVTMSTLPIVPENGAFKVRLFMVSSASSSVIFALSMENCNC